jgi:FKBP-type peptidyl-prolyl cis-trans isomerase
MRKLISASFVLSIALVMNVNAAAPKSTKAPSNAVEFSTGMHYQVIKAAPKGAKNIKPEFLEYRAVTWQADAKGKFIANDSGVQKSDFKSIATKWPQLARAFLLSPVGETRRWWVDGTSPNPIDITVLGNVDPAPAPKDVAAVPADATKTLSGLAYKAIKKGDGKASPTVNSTITIHYSGWTTDGKLFDSSVVRGAPATFPLNGLIKGWQEGIPLMKNGDTFRFWIPDYLAYVSNPRPGAPSGMLVFDVTLYSFE